jgi:hypothetical protein
MGNRLWVVEVVKVVEIVEPVETVNSSTGQIEKSLIRH